MKSLAEEKYLDLKLPAACAALALPTGRTCEGCGSSPVENALAFSAQGINNASLVFMAIDLYWQKNNRGII
jgi:hypothetical protein